MDSSEQHEATINPDGSSTYQEAPPTTAAGGDVPPPVTEPLSASSNMPPTIDPTTTTAGADGAGSGSGNGFFDEGAGDNGGMPNFDDLPPVHKPAQGIDPAIYLIVAFVVIVAIYWFFFWRKKAEEEEDDFFASIDGDKFEKLQKLPSEVDDYYKTRAKVESMGWVPGQGPPSQEAVANPQHPHRIIASALMKRAMADIPNVMTIQKESSGMSKLYARSMCSVRQWKSYQMAEQVISQEIADVKAEADDIEPGWSHSIWQQASQYHAMLKKKHETELQAAQEKAKAAKAHEAKAASAAASAATPAASNSKKGAAAAAAKPIEDDPKARELAAQKAAEELLREEEKEKKKGGKAFSGGGVKKGFLEGGGKGGKKK